jgi:hypothetical protein
MHEHLLRWLTRICTNHLVPHLIYVDWPQVTWPENIRANFPSLRALRCATCDVNGLPPNLALAWCDRLLCEIRHTPHSAQQSMQTLAFRWVDSDFWDVRVPSTTHAHAMPNGTFAHVSAPTRYTTCYYLPSSETHKEYQWHHVQPSHNPSACFRPLFDMLLLQAVDLVMDSPWTLDDKVCHLNALAIAPAIQTQ